MSNVLYRLNSTKIEVIAAHASGIKSHGYADSLDQAMRAVEDNVADFGKIATVEIYENTGKTKKKGKKVYNVFELKA